MKVNIDVEFNDVAATLENVEVEAEYDGGTIVALFVERAVLTITNSETGEEL